MSDKFELLQQRIRDKAYELWESAGSPDGEEERFWLQAQGEIDQDEAKLDRDEAASFPASDLPSP
jgi:hypothetical protein